MPNVTFCSLKVTKNIVISQVKGKSDCFSSYMRCYRHQTCVAAFGGFSRTMERSSSPPRTRKSWQRCGADARATGKPWRTRKWPVPCETIREQERSAKWSVNLPISSLREHWEAFRTTRKDSWVVNVVHPPRLSPSWESINKYWVFYRGWFWLFNVHNVMWT